ALRCLAALSNTRRNWMIKLVTRKRMFGLFRGQEEEHRDIHEDLFGQLAQQLPDRGLPFDAVHAPEVRVDNAEANGHRVLPTSFSLPLGVCTSIFGQDVQNLLDLQTSLCATFSPCYVITAYLPMS